MRILTGLVFIVNISLWVIGIVFGFSAEGGVVGYPGIIGFLTFLIAWHLSGGIVVAPADYFFQPEWDVFKTKLKWANSSGTIAFFVALLISSSLH